MAGRPITNNSPRAVKKREQMRQARLAMKVRPVPFNPFPLAQIVSTWSNRANQSVQSR